MIFSKPILPKIVYDKIEEDVVNLYIELELDIPLIPKQVLERLNYEIHYFSEIVNETELAVLINSKDSQRDGLSFYNPNKKTYEIWINNFASDYEPRLGFTIMHEIGHIRLGHKGSSKLAEMEANYYAAYALVPSPLPHWMKFDSYIEIAQNFNVSFDSAYYSSSRIENWLYYGKPKSYEKRFHEYYDRIKKG